MVVQPYQWLVFVGAAWFYGDPHIRTIDGFQYTFNGLGEYTLVETTLGNFVLQGRTALALDATGTTTKATVFSAFAAKEVDSDTVHVEMTATGKGTWYSNSIYGILQNTFVWVFACGLYVRIYT